MAEVERLVARYVVMPPHVPLVVGCWVAAAWLAEVWDRFPNLGVTSPEKGCGKTLLLRLMSLITPNAVGTTNISPAAVYRLIELRKPTLLLDEAQSLTRRGSESAEVVRELLNAGIDRDAKVLRVGGERFDQVQEFGVYCPKVLALIGNLDSVLADRTLPVRMARKTAGDAVERFRSRAAAPEAERVRVALEAWAGANKERVTDAYDAAEEFDISDDRMAELLLPLQAVLAVDDPPRLGQLRRYADQLEAADREAERMSPGVRLLGACREVFGAHVAFVPTVELIRRLVGRSEEPWATYTRGGPITPEALAGLLRPYDVRTVRNKTQTHRGYDRQAFAEAFARYLPPPSPGSSAIPANRPSLPKGDPASPLARILLPQFGVEYLPPPNARAATDAESEGGDR